MYIAHLKIHLSISGHLGYIHVLAIVNNSAVNMEVRFLFEIMIWIHARNEITGSYGSSIFIFIFKDLPCFHGGCSIYIPRTVHLAVSVHCGDCGLAACSRRWRLLMAGLLAISFFTEESCCVCLQRRSPQTAVNPAVWLLWEPLIFFLVFSHLCTSQLCLALGYWNGTFMLYPELVTHPALSFPATGIFSSWRVPSRCWALLPWEMGPQKQNVAAFLLFLCCYSLLLFWVLFHFVADISFMRILASRILCCGSNRQIHTHYRNPVEKKGWHGHSLSEREGERARESPRESPTPA